MQVRSLADRVHEFHNQENEMCLIRLEIGRLCRCKRERTKTSSELSLTSTSRRVEAVHRRGLGGLDGHRNHSNDDGRRIRRAGRMQDPHAPGKNKLHAHRHMCKAPRWEQCKTSLSDRW